MHTRPSQPFNAWPVAPLTHDGRYNARLDVATRARSCVRGGGKATRHCLGHAGAVRFSAELLIVFIPAGPSTSITFCSAIVVPRKRGAVLLAPNVGYAVRSGARLQRPLQAWQPRPTAGRTCTRYPDMNRRLEWYQKRARFSGNRC